MSAYRFCRSDDVPLIVEAFHRCNVGPGRVPWRLTVDDMKRLSREINLWTSSCMVALAGSDPIGVLIAAKREPTANLVLHVGVHPDHRRQGHARHMLTSLTRKMAILEPTRMFAEAPAEAIAARRFLSACGFAEEATLIDYVYSGESSRATRRMPARNPGGAIRATREPVRAPIIGRTDARPAQPVSAASPFLDLVGTVSPSELTTGDDFPEATELNRCWQRSVQTILNLRQRALAIGIATDQGFEAWLLYRGAQDADDPLPFLARPVASSPGDGPAVDPAPCEILAIGGKRPVPALLGPLLAFAARESGRSLYLPRVHPREPLADRLDDYGFRAARETVRYACDAVLS